MLGWRLYKLVETVVPSLIKIALIALALGAGYFAGDAYQWYQNQQTKISLDDYCLLSTQPCSQDDIVITLDRDVSQPLVPTQIQVKWPSTKADALMLSLEGYEMEMGTTLFKLTKSQNNLYTGELILPVCTLEAMTWVGHLSDGNIQVNTALRMER
tara:strand:- start:1293 stop:1760 length:468 start_codon:yes stop_codon:yes gene_type:complete